MHKHVFGCNRMVMFVCVPITSCLSNSFHQHRLSNTKLHPQVGRTQLVQTQVHTAQQVIWKKKHTRYYTEACTDTNREQQTPTLQTHTKTLRRYQSHTRRHTNPRTYGHTHNQTHANTHTHTNTDIETEEHTLRTPPNTQTKTRPYTLTDITSQKTPKRC